MENRRAFCKRTSFVFAAAAGSVLTSRVNASSKAASDIAIGAETLPYFQYPLERALEGIREAGYKHFTAAFKHEGKKLLYGGMPKGEIQLMKQLFAESGMTLRMGLIGWDLDPKSGKGRDEYKRQLDLFAELGLSFGLTGGPWRYTKFPSVRKPTLEWKEECDRFLEGLAPVAQHAHSVGITLVMKPHTGLTATAWDCLRLMKRTQWPALKIAWDDGNVSFYEGLRPDTDLPILAPHVRAWCIKDHTGGRANMEFPVPGDGDVDLKGTLRTLLEAGFDGPATVELVSEKRPVKEIDQRLARACKNMTAIVESLSHS